MKPARRAAEAPDAVSPPASEKRPAVLRLEREALRSVRENEGPALVAAQLEAGERYADDDGSRELDDIRAGRHPLQQGGHHEDAWTAFEAKLAAIRADR